MLTVVWLLATVLIVERDSSASGVERHWSPYYEIEATPIIRNGVRIGSNITVNKDSHQQALDLSERSTTDRYITGRARLYNLPYDFATPKRVLVVGAGTGNDTAAALAQCRQPHEIDAVEIDPVIARLGSSLHPEHPYDAANVNVVIDDARSFLQKSDERYDLIVFGFLDSHRLFSHMSSVRMDNYVYTLENFRRVKERLTDDGVAAVTFTIHEKWIADRIFTVMTKAFGHPPLVYQGDANGYGTTFLTGPKQLSVPASSTVIDVASAKDQVFADRKQITWRYSDTEGYLDSALFSDHAELLTDDWPFLYMRSRSIPPNYMFALVLTFMATLLLVWRLVPSIDMKRSSNWNFFALGAAFALLETRGITEIALVFGSTWVTNTIVIGAILTMILMANLVVARWHPPLTWVYAGLFGVVIIDFLFPLQRLLGLSLRNAGARGRDPGGGTDVLRRDRLRPLVRTHRHAERGARSQPHRRRLRRPARVSLAHHRSAEAVPVGAALLRRVSSNRLWIGPAPRDPSWRLPRRDDRPALHDPGRRRTPADDRTLSPGAAKRSRAR